MPRSTARNGSIPGGGLIADTASNLYGTTTDGGNLSLNNGNGEGTVFKISPGGALTTLASFNGTNGASPRSGLISDAAGNLYGTTGSGGAYGDGSIFELTPSGTLTTLFSFGAPGELSEGVVPTGGLIADAAGNLYGTTSQGGNQSVPGGLGFSGGTVFKLTPGGTLTTLASFNGSDGANPDASLIADAAGNLYGTTQNGGANYPGFGTVFKISGAGFVVSMPLTWNNAGATGDGATWDIGANRNWAGNFSGAYADGCNVTFNDANNGNYTVTLNGAGQPRIGDGQQ